MKEEREEGKGREAVNMCLGRVSLCWPSRRWVVLRMARDGVGGNPDGWMTGGRMHKSVHVCVHN